MNPQHLSYLKDPNIIWFNPCWGYFGFWRRFREFQKERNIDFQSAWSDRDMKRNKELYATSLVALSMQQDAPTKHGWWFTKPPQDPPDGVIGTILESSKGNMINVREIEVVEYFDGSLLNTLKDKMKNKSYEPNTALVCLLSPNTTGAIDLIGLSQQIQNIQFPLTYIFAVFHGFEMVSLPKDSTLQDMIKTNLVQLTPEYVVISFSPHVCCKMWLDGKDRSFLKLIGRGKDTELHKITADSRPKLFD